MGSRGTPIDALPEFQVEDDMQEQVQMQEQEQVLRPQARQLQGPNIDDMSYLEGSLPQPPRRPRAVKPPVKQEDWQTYLLREGKIPLVAAVLYFLLNLEAVDVQLLKYIPRLFNRDYELTMGGVAFKAAVLAVALMLVKHFLK